MNKQKLINKYFKKLTSDKFFKNDDETIIGKAGDVIDEICKQTEILKDSSDEYEAFIFSETNSLVKEIKDTYSDMNDVIMISFHPMVGYYSLIEINDVYEELKEYYDELEDK